MRHETILLIRVSEANEIGLTDISFLGSESRLKIAKEGLVLTAQSIPASLRIINIHGVYLILIVPKDHGVLWFVLARNCEGREQWIPLFIYVAHFGLLKCLVHV